MICKHKSEPEKQKTAKTTHHKVQTASPRRGSGSLETKTNVCREETSVDTTGSRLRARLFLPGPWGSTVSPGPQGLAQFHPLHSSSHAPPHPTRVCLIKTIKL